MALIKLHKDPLNPLRCETIHAYGNLLARLKEYAPWATHVLRNGKEISVEQADIELSEFDEINVLAVPQAGLAWHWQLAIAVGAAAVSYALMPKPEMPNNTGKAKDSPNNKLNAATNAFRPRQAMPHIFGAVRAYSDFIQPSYYFYEANLKTQHEVFLVTAGSADVSDVRSSDTPITDYTVYKPGDTLPEFFDVRQVQEVSQFQLPPPDDYSESYATDIGSISDYGLTVSGKGVVKTLSLDAGDVVEIVFNGETLGGGSIQVSVERTVNSINGDSSFEVTQSIPTGVEVANGYLWVNVISGTNDRTQWFTLSGKEIEQVWFNITAPNGLQDENGDKLTIMIEFQVQAVTAVGTPIGEIISEFGYITGDNLDAVYMTYRVEGLSAGRYRARALRRTIKQAPNSVEKVVLESLYSVTPIDTSKYGDVTIIEVTRTAGVQQSGGGTAKINALVEIELPIFDPNTGTFGALAKTRSFAQAVMYLLVYLGGESLDNIDYEKLFEIESSLSDPRLGYFDFTFDDEDISIEQAVETILNAARCYHYFVGSRWSFGRDEWRTIRSALFGRRNTIPERSRQEFTFYRQGEYDSVELTYVDPVSNDQGYIRRRINQSTGAIEDGLGDRVNHIDLAGCRNIGQATDRAELEIRKIKYMWAKVTDTVTADGLLIGIGERVGWSDINDSDVQDGEVLDFDGVDVFTTSEPLSFNVGATYYGYIIESDGSASSPFEVLPVAGDDYKFQAVASGLTPAIADGYNVQVGSTYIIAEEDRLNATDFTVISRGKPDELMNVEIELVNADERVYEMDGQPLPDPELRLTSGGGSVVVDSETCVSAQAVGYVEAVGGDGNYTYAWSKVSGDGGIVSGVATDTVTVEWPSVCPEETLTGVFRCTVSSSDYIQSIDVVFSAENIAVQPALAVSVTGGVGAVRDSGSCPIVDATAAATATGGTKSYTYTWTKISGDGSIQSGASTDTCTVRFAAVCPTETLTGVYRVTVDDGVDTVFEDVTFTASNKG